ncbi:MFS transporter [Streptomyces sp. NPDC101234]|uniref:MFS transporter n=1 Tax=Streptomyces sp. NPDC101234 TaxID=3366138 RepID=UPI0038284042
MLRTRSPWWVLATAGLAQLMIVLDSTVVTIALPVAQRDLGISETSRGWVITAYALAFGGLLLVGGRLSDRLGLRRAFVVGLVGFAVASVLAGLAPTARLLFAGRAAQGVFAALLAPAGLSIISRTYSQPRERGIAFGVFGAITGAGAATGLLLGGALTEYVSWRWGLLINVPIVVLALVWTALFVPSAPRHAVRIDVGGVLTSVIGLTALVFALSEGAVYGWGSPAVLGCFAVAVVSTVGFVVAHGRVREPLLPFHIVLHRERGASFLAFGLPQVALFGFYLVMTYWFQELLGYSPLLAGAAFVPFAAATAFGSTVLTPRLSTFLQPRTLVICAIVALGLGTLLLVGMDPGGDALFLTRFLPAQLLAGTGLGCALSTAISMATHGVDPSEAGVASAAVNAITQLGGAIGTALLNTIAAMVTAAALGGAEGASTSVADATVDGFDVAMLTATGVLALTAVLVAAVMPRRTQPAPETRPVEIAS